MKSFIDKGLVFVIILVLSLGVAVPAQAVPAESPLAAVFGPSLVKDIRSGAIGSDPSYLAVYNGKLYFQANDGTNGDELWVSDGTSAGTKMVKNIYAGANGSFPADFAVFNGKLYFSASDSTYGRELWVTDGTSLGTKLVKDIYPVSTPSAPSNLVVYNGMLYFSASNGGGAGKGRELWKSNGTELGTVLAADIWTGTGNSSPAWLTVYNGKLYFSAQNGTNGIELWKSDGTQGGTEQVKDIRPVASNSSPSYLTVLNGKLYFSANDGTHDDELWVSDGTAAGTNMVLDLNPGGSAGVFYLTVFNGHLYFDGRNGGDNYEPWKSDGTAVGTSLLKDIAPGTSSDPDNFIVYNGKLYFQADDQTNGYELWETDGTTAGTKMTANINPGGAHSSPEFPAVLNGKLFFGADNGSQGNELMVYETSYIFGDGFESGDTSAWSSITGAFEDGDYTDEGKCKLCVDTTYVLDGKYGLKVRIPNKKPHYLTDSSPESETRYRARFYIKAKGLKMSSGSSFKLFQGKMGKKQPFFLLVRKFSKKFKIRSVIRTDKGKNLKAKWTTLPKKPSYVEVDWMAAKSKSKHNGYIKLYVNGKLKRTKAKVDNDKMVIDEVRLGVTQKIAKTSKISGAFYLDAFASDWLDYLGP